MHIDREIEEVEQRLAQRRVKVELLARASKRRVVRAVTSPAGLLGAAAVGALAIIGVTRRHHHAPRRSADKRGIFRTLGGIAASAAMSGVVALIRAQFGGPAGLAQFVLEKFRRAPSQRPVVH